MYSRLLPIPIEVRPNEDRLRAEPDSASGGQSRADPESARFVARSGHHSPPFRATSDDNRLAGESRVVPHVHRRIEAVHVAVQDPSIRFDF